VTSDGIPVETVFNPHRRRPRLFVGSREDRGLVHRLLSILTGTYAQVANCVKSQIGTCAVATNRSMLNVDPKTDLHSNCFVYMVSPTTCEEFLIPYEQYLAERLQPYGIRHCGGNLRAFAEAIRHGLVYAE